MNHLPATSHPDAADSALAPRDGALRAITELTRALSRAPDHAGLRELAARALVRGFADGCAVRLEGAAPPVVVAHRDAAREPGLHHILAAQGRALADGPSLLLTQFSAELRDQLSPAAREFIARAAPGGLIATPIPGRAGVVGELVVWRERTSEPFAGDAADALRVCSEHIGLAIDHAAAYRELQVRQARFELAARATQDVLWDWDLATREVLWSEAVSTTLGWPPGQVDSTLDWWSDRVHDDDRARVLAGLDEVIHAGAPGTRWQDEYRFRRGDGSYADIIDRGYVLRDDAGRPTRAVGSMQDITDRKRDERALRDGQELFARAFGKNPNAMSLNALSTCEYLDANEALAAAIGLPRAAMLGRTPQELGVFVDPGTAERLFARLRRHGSVRDAEVRVRGADGAARTILWSAEILALSGRHCVLTASTDITERRAAERERERLVDDLQAAVAVRDEFLVIASHELRTPLTALALHLEGLSRLVDRGPRDPDALAGKVGGAIRQVDRLAGLVGSLLDVGELGRGRPRLALAEFELTALLRELAERAAPEAARARCELRVDCPIEQHVCWDRLQIDRALGHVLANALKYGAGRPVDVRARPRGDAVEIELEDRGIGLGEADARRIFGRFERAAPASHYGGLGLGLYIAHRIVEAHGGTIDVTSEPGVGSRFRVRLPRAAAPATEP